MPESKNLFFLIKHKKTVYITSRELSPILTDISYLPVWSLIKQFLKGLAAEYVMTFLRVNFAFICTQNWVVLSLS